MAIQLIKQNSKFNNLHQHFYIDNLSDLDSIENEYKCQMGDVAELPDGMQYQRHSDDYQGQKWEYWKGGGSGGSSGLPDVTTADNGNVLTVVEGAWAKAEPSGGQGGNNVLTINLDITTQALDKTWAEISAADVAVILFPVGDSKARLFVSSTSHDTAYDVQALFGAGSTPAVMNFTTNSADDYPILVQGD